MTTPIPTTTIPRIATPDISRADGGSSTQLVSMALAENTTDSGTSATVSATISATYRSADGEITASTSEIVITSGTTTDDGMNKNNSTASPMITVYSSTGYKPVFIDCDVNDGGCEEDCIRGVNGNDR